MRPPEVLQHLMTYLNATRTRLFTIADVFTIQAVELSCSSVVFVTDQVGS